MAALAEPTCTQDGHTRLTCVRSLRARARAVGVQAPLGIEVSKEEAGELFDAFDADGGGTIEYKELNMLLRRKLDSGDEKRTMRARQLRRAASEAGLLAFPTVPTNATIPSVASLGHLGGRAHRMSSFHGSQLLTTSFASLAKSASQPTLTISTDLVAPKLREEVRRLQRAHYLQASLSQDVISYLSSPHWPTNVFNWPEIQGVPDLDHLAQIWYAPRVGQAWRRQPNNTAVRLPPLSERIERERAAAAQPRSAPHSAAERTVAISG